MVLLNVYVLEVKNSLRVINGEFKSFKSLMLKCNCPSEEKKNVNKI